VRGIQGQDLDSLERLKSGSNRAGGEETGQADKIVFVQGSAESGKRSLGDEAAVVHYREAIAESLGFLHVVGSVENARSG